MKRVDLNCDMGESFGAWTMGADEAVLPHVTSANIACGFHAGDPAVMHRTVRAAAAHGVAVGAHPSLSDLVGFGRRRMDITPDEAYALVVYQVGALLGFTRAAGVRLTHVKPHGALYNMAATDARLAEAISCAVRDVDAGLVLFGLAGGALVREAERAGLRAASEVFADRGYEPDGILTPRGQPGALVSDPEEAAARAVRMVLEGKVAARGGGDIPVRVDTLCVHGDGPHAADIARLMRQRLEEAGVRVVPVGGAP
jgi:UPF0271 protein